MRYRSVPVTSIHTALTASILFIAGCGGSGPDPIRIANDFGGTGRANDYSSTEFETPRDFTSQLYDSLPAGFLGPPLSIGGGRLAIVVDGGGLAVLNRNAVLSSYRFGEEEYPLPELAADSLGTIYAATTRGLLCAISDSGTLRWKKPIWNTSGVDEFALPTWPLAVPFGIVVGGTGGDLVLFDRNGSEKWRKREGAAIARSVAYSDDAGIVIGVTSNSYDEARDAVAAYGADGAQKWRLPIDGRIEYGPIVAGDRIVVGLGKNDLAGDKQGTMIAIDSRGKKLWEAKLRAIPRGIAADAEGNLYVTGGGESSFGGGYVASFDVAGKLRWEAFLRSSIPSIPVVSANAVHFVGVQGNRIGLYTYRRDGAYLAMAPIGARGDLNVRPVIIANGIVLAMEDQPMLLRSATGGMFGL